MLRKKAVTPNIENTISKSVNFEVTIADIARRSERRAWFVAWSAILMSLVLAGGYYYMLPLKEKVPYLVMADAYTGTSTVAQLRGDFSVNSITASEAINRSNVAHFVLARESFDNSMIGQTDWDTVYTMAAPAVASEYTAWHDPANPNQAYKVYGRKSSLRVKILSTTLSEDSMVDGAPKGATVRFQRSIYDKASGTVRPLDSRIATLEFVYKNNLKMDEQKRILNPLGFQVTSYRVVTDYATSPPIQTEIIQSPYGAPPQPYAPVAPQPTVLDAQGNPMLPVGEPVPAVPQPTTTPSGTPPPSPPVQQQAPNPTNNANNGATTR
jgi:type IV secretion system protein VirB8